MAKKFLCLVVNGKVANNEALRAAVAQQRGFGHRVEVHVTWEGGDARRFASQPEADVVVAVGGDGTVNEVLHGLMILPTEARPALAVIPLGTANDFARGCGIPLDPSQALALGVAGDPVAADAGRANDRWFINAASIGFGAVVTATTPPELKRLLGGAAYTLMAAILATNFRPYEGRLLLPDQEVTGPDVVAIVCNGRQTGGGKQVARRAFLDDGLLDILVVREILAARPALDGGDLLRVRRHEIVSTFFAHYWAVGSLALSATPGRQRPSYRYGGAQRGASDGVRGAGTAVLARVAQAPAR